MTPAAEVLRVTCDGRWAVWDSNPHKLGDGAYNYDELSPFGNVLHSY